MRRLLALLPAMALAPLLAASTWLRPADDFAVRALPLEVKRIVPRGLVADRALRFVAGWKLTSGDPNFGGISALARDRGGFIALSDAGAIVRFTLDGDGRTRATIASLPAACGLNEVRTSRDTESLALDSRGAMWIGFEYVNRICRIGVNGRARLAHPRTMRRWPITRGAEAMARLDDGRFIVIGEDVSPNRARIAPGLIFAGDPTRRSSRVARFGYRVPAEFRATDAALLPDGKLLVLERAHRRMYSFPGQLAIVATDAIMPGAVLDGRVVLRLGPPGLDQNFEAIAVSRARGRTFVWLMSDDNFIPVQQTMLLLFEYRG